MFGVVLELWIVQAERGGGVNERGGGFPMVRDARGCTPPFCIRGGQGWIGLKEGGMTSCVMCDGHMACNGWTRVGTSSPGKSASWSPRVSSEAQSRPDPSAACSWRSLRRSAELGRAPREPARTPTHRRGFCRPPCSRALSILYTKQEFFFCFFPFLSPLCLPSPSLSCGGCGGAWRVSGGGGTGHPAALASLTLLLS